jgi:hypothetical protein
MAPWGDLEGETTTVTLELPTRIASILSTLNNNGDMEYSLLVCPADSRADLQKLVSRVGSHADTLSHMLSSVESKSDSVPNFETSKEAPVHPKMEDTNTILAAFMEENRKMLMSLIPTPAGGTNANGKRVKADDVIMEDSQDGSLGANEPVAKPPTSQIIKRWKAAFQSGKDMASTKYPNHGAKVFVPEDLKSVFEEEIEYLELSDNLCTTKTVVGKCTMVYNRIFANPDVQELVDDNAVMEASVMVWTVIRSFPQKDEANIGGAMAGWLRLKRSNTLTLDNIIYFLVMLRTLSFTESENPIIN